MQVQKHRVGYKLVLWHYGKKIEIPEEWEYEEIKRKIQILSGYAFKSEYFDNKTGTPLIRIRDLPYDSTEVFYNGKFEKEYLVHKGDFLVGMDGEFKPYLWKGKESLLNQRVCKITTDNEILDQKYLYYSIEKELFHYELINIGTTVIHISKSDIEKIRLPLPPIKEQQKIAPILSNVDSLIQQTQKEIEQTQRLKKGLMQRLLTKGIEHTKFKKTKLGEIPEEWIETKLGSFIMLQRGHDLPDNLRIKGNIPVIGSNGIVGYHNENKAKGPGVIIGRSGTLGKVYYVEDDYWPLNTSLYVKEFYSSHPKFVYYFLQNIKYENFNAGTSVPTLNRNHLHPLRITIPKFAEQQEIASILSNIDTLIQKKHENKSKLETLKKGLMQKLLTGQIRVKV